jgi:hypothetical protein
MGKGAGTTFNANKQLSFAVPIIHIDASYAVAGGRQVAEGRRFSIVARSATMPSAETR